MLSAPPPTTSLSSTDGAFSAPLYLQYLLNGKLQQQQNAPNSHSNSGKGEQSHTNTPQQQNSCKQKQQTTQVSVANCSDQQGSGISNFLRAARWRFFLPTEETILNKLIEKSRRAPPKREPPKVKDKIKSKLKTLTQHMIKGVNSTAQSLKCPPSTTDLKLCLQTIQAPSSMTLGRKYR